MKHLSKAKPPLDPHGIALHDISFDVHEGEILGIAGLMGAGRTEVARCLFGADKYTTGEFILDGEPYQPTTPMNALDKGIALVPEDRKKKAPRWDYPFATTYHFQRYHIYLKWGGWWIAIKKTP